MKSTFKTQFNNSKYDMISAKKIEFLKRQKMFIIARPVLTMDGSRIALKWSFRYVNNLDLINEKQLCPDFKLEHLPFF